MYIGKKMGKIRKEKGLTQRQLADIIQPVERGRPVTKSRIAGYETGDRTPRLEMFVNICKALDVTPNELLGYDG